MAAANNKNASADSWAEYRRLVLAELERLDGAVTRLAQASLDHEKEILESTNSVKTETTAKIQHGKDETIEKVRKMINDLRLELMRKTDKECDSIEQSMNGLEKRINRIQIEIQVLKGKAALLGFVAGLVVAILSIIAQLVWSK